MTTTIFSLIIMLGEDDSNISRNLKPCFDHY